MVKGLLVVAAVLLAAQVAGAAPETPCPVGAAREVETLEKLQTQPFVMGCADLRHQGRLEVIAYREGRKLPNSFLCLEMQAAFVSTATCRRPSEPLHGLEHSDLVRLKKRWAVTQGFASSEVGRVNLRYRSGGKLRRPRGVLSRLTDPALLDRLALGVPLVHFAAEASVRTRSAQLLARDRGGKLIFRRTVRKP